MNEEILKGLSIEELEERAEFTAAFASEFSQQELEAYAEAYAQEPSMCNPCTICRC